MCGIAGFDIKPGTVREGQIALLASALGFMNDERGGHSWGAACFKDDGEFEVKKGLGKIGPNVYELVGYNRLFLHTRLATTGARTVENAHPFEIGNVIGAHNGIVYNHHELSRKYSRKYEVDSMHFFGHLAENKPFGEIEGYGALEWFYSDDPTTTLITRMRNGDLSVYGIGKDPNDTDGIVWSSREDHLVKALGVAGIKNIYRYTLDEGVVFSVRNGNLFVTKMRADLSSRSYGTGYCGMTWEDHRDMQNDTGKVVDYRKGRKGDKKSGAKGSNFIMKSAESSAQVFALADKSTVDDDVELVDLDDLKKLDASDLTALIARGDLDEEDLLELGVITQEQLEAAEKEDNDDIENLSESDDSRPVHSVPLSEDLENINVEDGVAWHQFCTLYSQERG